MDDVYYTLFLFPVVGLLFIFLGLPLKQGKIPPNHWYGFRTRKTLTNEKIWYEINKITGEDMVKIGVVVMLSSLLILSFRGWLPVEAAVAIQTTIVLASVAWMAIRGFSLLNKM
jgi:uncharacterized membrane protein